MPILFLLHTGVKEKKRPSWQLTSQQTSAISEDGFAGFAQIFARSTVFASFCQTELEHLEHHPASVWVFELHPLSDTDTDIDTGTCTNTHLFSLVLSEGSARRSMPEVLLSSLGTALVKASTDAWAYRTSQPKATS